ncbi:MAG: hypothetical protein V1735_03765 [Nanoarchaeota archaeon]
MKQETVGKLEDRITDLFSQSGITAESDPIRFGQIKEFREGLDRTGFPPPGLEAMLATLDISAKWHAKHDRRDGRYATPVKYIIHPIEAMMKLMIGSGNESYSRDWRVLCASLLHDAIEEIVDHSVHPLRDIRPPEGSPEREQAIQDALRLRVNRRAEMLDILRKQMAPAYQRLGISNGNAEYVLFLVKRMSRYKDQDQSYYRYIEQFFDHRYKPLEKVIRGITLRSVSPREFITNSVLIKHSDRQVNIRDMDGATESSAETENQLAAFRRTYEMDKAAYAALQPLPEPGPRMTTQNRLFEVWKNIYLILRTRQYTARKGDTKSLDRAVADTIGETLKEVQQLKRYISLYHHQGIAEETGLASAFDYLDRMEELRDAYDSGGDLRKRTASTGLDRTGGRERTRPLDKSDFDGTIDYYHERVHKNKGIGDDEVKALPKHVQFNDTLTFERILEHCRDDPFFEIESLFEKKLNGWK